MHWFCLLQRWLVLAWRKFPTLLQLYKAIFGRKVSRQLLLQQSLPQWRNLLFKFPTTVSSENSNRIVILLWYWYFLLLRVSCKCMFGFYGWNCMNNPCKPSRCDNGGLCLPKHSGAVQDEWVLEFKPLLITISLTYQLVSNFLWTCLWLKLVIMNCMKLNSNFAATNCFTSIKYCFK